MQKSAPFNTFVVPIVVPFLVYLHCLKCILICHCLKLSVIIFRKDKINKNNEIPLYIHIIKNRKTKLVSQGISLTE
jgi:hypothetical protein